MKCWRNGRTIRIRQNNRDKAVKGWSKLQEHEYKARDKTVQKMSGMDCGKKTSGTRKKKGSPGGIRIPRFPAVRRKRN